MIVGYGSTIVFDCWGKCGSNGLWLGNGRGCGEKHIQQIF